MFLSIRSCVGFCVLLCVGCHGVMTQPMVERLNAEEQEEVDTAWLNMLDPVDRLDETLLLDVLLMHGYYQHGVDSLQLTSVKHVGDHDVVMDVQFDIDRPDDDAFVVTVFDRNGYAVREHRYTRAMMDERFNLYRCGAAASARVDEYEQRDPASLTLEERSELEEARGLAEALADRIEEIHAATQPAAP